MINLSEKDIAQLMSKGITEEKVLDQITTFEEGIPFVFLERPATIGDGILKFTKAEEERLVEDYRSAKERFKILKFVPASGAASRMFKLLFEFLDQYDPGTEDIDDFINRTNNDDLQKFLSGLKEFPFYQLVRDRIDPASEKTGSFLQDFVREMLNAEKLHYDFYPKGLLPFHNYDGKTTTAFEEHLNEGALYASSAGTSRLHFTVSEQHEDMFMDLYRSVKEDLEKKNGVVFIVNFSRQKPSTDTIAVTPENSPFRDEDDTILFRPGGHGALIENLNDQNADIIFIKNIDNVVVESYADQIAFSKEVLGGLLTSLQDKAHRYANWLDKNDLEGQQLNEILEFLTTELNVRLASNFTSFSIAEQIEILRDKINRPIRVCGMVKNEGEPGGGPFWIRDQHGHISLQIVESAQVDKEDSGQAALFEKSTHFNPVDIVCGVTNYKGEKYNLLNFVDEKQGFISEKTKDGKALKALELPGLWNGAMAYWNTVFVEVPLITFNPVKTVNDLLRPPHQVGSVKG